MSLLHQFKSELATTGLFKPKDRLLLAISGGLDSVVLLNLLLECGYQAALAHCNFQLRGTASKGDADFVEAMAQAHGLVCHHKAFATKAYATKKGLSTQMAARELRYAWFEELVAQQGYDYVLTAHHFDDNLETLLLNFLRGTGLRGLTGIPPARDFYRRPLLFASRSDLEAYQQQHQLPFREDESNASDEYQRNYLRHHVLPHLYHLQPELRQVGPTNFSRLQAAKALWDRQLEELYTRYLITDAKGELYLDRKDLEAHPQVDLLLWEWLSPKGFNAEQIRQMRESEPGTVIESRQAAVLVTENCWYLGNAANIDPDWSACWEEGGERMELPNGQLITLQVAKVDQFDFSSTSKEQVYVSQRELQFPLTLRYRQPGDTFCPFGMGGKHQKLKDFFINQKINRWQRARTPILVNGDGRIIWVVGHRLDERFRGNKEDQLMSFRLEPVLSNSRSKEEAPNGRIGGD